MAMRGCGHELETADAPPGVATARFQRELAESQLPLDERQREALLSALRFDRQGDPLQWHLRLQRTISGRPLVAGNAVDLLMDGSQAFPAIFDAIAGARDHVNMEFFILEDVSWQGRRLSELLLDRLHNGVRVNILYDAFGSGTTPAEMFDALRDAGAQVAVFNRLNPVTARTPWSPNNRDHRKIVVVDGAMGFTGGINLQHVYENPPGAGTAANVGAGQAHWRDTALRIEGPAVADLQRLFFTAWEEQKAPSVQPARYYPRLEQRGNQSVQIIGSAPGDQRPLYFVSLMTAALSAVERVWLSTGYFVPPREEDDAFRRIGRQGIDLRFILPSQSDVQGAVHAARAGYGALLEAGAHIYEMHAAVLHSKLATVDGVWSVVGSSNLDRRSVVFNKEIDVIILGRETAARIEAIQRDYIRQSHEVTLEEWRRRSIWERLRELRARLWQYWM